MFSYFNEITYKGFIPESLGSLMHLKELRLCENLLEGEIRYECDHLMHAFIT
jgi:hypothetical protein